jgi:tryptophan-rich sensory protein
LIIFVLSLVACFSAAALGSIFTANAIPGWYAELQKPVFNPPNWVFGPVWTALYTLQAFSLYILWVKHYKAKRELLTLFGVQLGLNALWSVVFFGLHSPEAALVIIAALWGLIFHIIRKSRKISKIASNLLWPYLAWVSFATLLNVAIALLN